MNEPDQAGWMHTLAQVDESIRGCLAQLDRYEQAFGHLYAEATGPKEQPVDRTHDPRLESLEKVWVERLSTAQRAADEVEALLIEQQNLWGQWLDSYNLWKQSLERMPGDTPESGHAENRRDTPRRRKVGAVR